MNKNFGLDVRPLTDKEKPIALALTPLLHVCVNAKDVTDNKIRAYAIALSDLDLGALSAGVTRCLQTKTFFPSIPEIREAANSMTEYVTGTGMKSPDEAWKEVQRQMQEAFVYKKPVFSTPEIEQAATSMGWIGLCETPTDVIGVARAQFLKLYDSVCSRKREHKINDQVLQSLSANGLLGETVRRIGQGKEAAS